MIHGMTWWLAALALTAGAALAQDTSMGAREFANSCAPCHGADGAGEGFMAAFLKTPPPDLTAIQQANGGVFPVSEVYAIIDGSAGGVHGDREMPAWGDRYMVEADQQLGDHYPRADRAAFAKARILALIEYVASLQVE